MAAGGSTEGTIKVYNVSTGELVKSIDSGGGAVYSMDFSADGKTVFGSCADNSLRAFDVATGGATVIDHQTGWGYHTWDVSRDGKYVAGPGKGGIVVWDQKTYTQVRVLQGNTGGSTFVAFSPDSKTLASTGADGVVRLWSVTTGELVSTPGDKLGGGTRLRFSEDGRRLAVWGQDRKVHIYGPSKDGRAQPKIPVDGPARDPGIVPDEED